MRKSLVAVFLFSLVQIVHAQGQRLSPVQFGQFEAQIQKQLREYKHGDFLYAECDIFRKIQERRAELALGFSAPTEAEDIGVDDTTLVGDVTRTSNDENETSIAINRQHPNVIAAGANDASMYTVGMPIYYTSNAGVSWRTYRMPALRVGTCQPGGDPMLVAGPDSVMYYAYLIYDNDVLRGSAGISDIIVARSEDGKFWMHTRPVMNKQDPETTFEDKESLAVDLDSTSPYYRRLYVVWVHYEDDFGRESLNLASSDDEGMTWSDPTTISDSTGYFSMVRIGSKGKIYISSSSTHGSTNHWLMVSDDGGATFTRRLIHNYTQYPANIDARPSLKGTRGFRAFPYTAFDVDRSTNTLYMTFGTWQNDEFAAVYATKSNDDGRTWTSPVMIGSQGLTSVDHFLPWVTYDQVHHDAAVAFYSSEDDPQNQLLRFNCANFDSLGSVEALGKETFDPLTITRGGRPFIGDYVGADAFNGYYAAAWTENRIGHTDGDVFAFVRAPVSATRSVQRINAISFSLSSAYPTPSLDGTTTFTVTLTEPKRFSIDVLDAVGRLMHHSTASVQPGSHDIVLDLPTLGSGTYYVSFNADGESLTRPIVIRPR